MFTGGNWKVERETWFGIGVVGPVVQVAVAVSKVVVRKGRSGFSGGDEASFVVGV